MPDQVVQVDAPAESTVADATAPAVADAPATPEFDEATWKARLRGKDQALTQAQREREQLAKERDALMAERQARLDAEKSDLDRALDRIKALETETATAKAQAAAATLARQYPRAAEALGDDIALLSSERIAELDGRLAREAAEASEGAEPRVDPNSPGRRPAKSAANTPQDVFAEARQKLVDAGNPFFDDKWR